MLLFGVLWTKDFEPLAVNLLLSVVIVTVTEHGVPLYFRLVDLPKGSLSLKVQEGQYLFHL